DQRPSLPVERRAKLGGPLGRQRRNYSAVRRKLRGCVRHGDSIDIHHMDGRTNRQMSHADIDRFVHELRPRPVFDWFGDRKLSKKVARIAVEGMEPKADGVGGDRATEGLFHLTANVSIAAIASLFDAGEIYEQ